MSQVSVSLLFGLGALFAICATYPIFLKRRTASALNRREDPLVFLIRDNRLADANFAAQRLLEKISGPATEFGKLQLYLGRHFKDIDRLLAPANVLGDLSTQSHDAQTQIARQTSGSSVRLTVRFIDAPYPDDDDIHTRRSVEAELETLRANTSSAPFLLWRQNTKGEITWVNQAYLDAARSVCGTDHLTWPLPVVFPSLSKVATPNRKESRRVAVKCDGEDESSWFDCHITTVGDDILCTAIPADEAVQAENRRREFTQTLTKTFAELAIGLAIFDRARRLVLFNPALMDLTSLPSDFLTGCPSLVGFLDRLRENRVMPEPRDYRSWRASISELEAAAVDGTYSETWSLPDGQTYHVTGRPHPDGAVALLFEDISAEMALTRHFRAELELSQSVLDNLDEAIAVFSPSGDLVVANTAYRSLWQLDDNSFQASSLTDALRRWHEMTTPTPIWGDLREFALQGSEREEWGGSVSLRDGRKLHCRFTPQKGGATMLVFRIANIAVHRLQEAV